MGWWSNSTPENQQAYGGQQNPLQETVDKAKATGGNPAARNAADSQNGGGKR